MNAAHIHLMMNHLPLFAALFGGGLLAVGLVKRRQALKSAGLVLGLIAGLGGVAAAQSGARAEDMVEDYRGVDTTALEEHEEAGEKAQWALVALGLISLTAMVLPREREQLRTRTEWLALVVFLAVFALVARTAQLGGPIRHPEITESALGADSGGEEVEDEHR